MSKSKVVVDLSVEILGKKRLVQLACWLVQRVRKEAGEHQCSFHDALYGTATKAADSIRWNHLWLEAGGRISNDRHYNVRRWMSIASQMQAFDHPANDLSKPRTEALVAPVQLSLPLPEMA